jgi:hypothetical protein
LGVVDEGPRCDPRREAWDSHRGILNKMEETVKIKAHNNEIKSALKHCASFLFLLTIVAGGVVRILTAVPQ